MDPQSGGGADQIHVDMPGRLMAETNVETNNPQPVVKPKLTPQPFAADTNATSGGKVDAPPQSSAHPVVNDEKQPNGIAKEEQHSETELLPPSALNQLPPELEHITIDFHPLSRLFGRASQECFNGLNTLIEELSASADAPQPNGVPSSGDNAQTSDTSARMRIRWLEFAHRQRQTFMKLLVISQWGKRAPDVSKLIDVSNWLRKQEEQFNVAEWSLGNVKRGAANARVLSPDIDTALEVLREDRQPRLPDLGYLPSKRLDPQKVLSTLRDLNVLLHERLNLHEDLPPYLKQYTIQDGRVTFVVTNEFEVDLAIADEDFSSQFWFQDVRFLFTSVADTVTGQLRGSIEQRVNAALATHGLAGCFEVLHEFSLTLKISIIRQQAIDMSRGAWSGSLGIEQLNRSLVIHYWSNKKGKKSWLQIGVKQGQRKRYESWAGYWPSVLSLKWVQNGKAVDGPCLPVDILQSSAEQILNSALAQHITSVMTILKDKLEQSDDRISSLLAPLLTKSDREPADCALRIPSRHSRDANVLIEPVSGKFVLQPATAASMKLASELNNLAEPGVHFNRIIEKWPASEIKQRTEDRAKHAGWITETPTGANREYVRNTFGADTIDTFYLRKPRWTESSWHVVVASTTNSETIYVAQVARENGALLVKQHERLPAPVAAPVLENGSTESFARLELFAISTISTLTLQQRCDQVGVHWTQQSKAGAQIQPPSRLEIDIAPLVVGSQDGDSSFKIFEHTRIHLENSGWSNSDGAQSLVFLVQGRLNRGIAGSGVLDGLKSRLFTFNNSGIFSLRTDSRLGSSSVVDNLGTQLQRIERLGALLSIMRDFKVRCESLSRDTVKLQFANGHSRAVISMKDNGLLHLDHLEPSSSVHGRVVRLINQHLSMLGSRTSFAFKVLLRTLVYLLTILTALDALEAADPKATRLRISSHGLTRFAILYSQLGVVVGFDYVAHRGDPFWCATIRPIPSKEVSPPSRDKFLTAWRGLQPQPGEEWWEHRAGKTAKTATLNGVQSLISKIDISARSATGETQTEGNSVLDRVVAPQAQKAPQNSRQQANPGNPKLNQKKGGDTQNAIVID